MATIHALIVSYGKVVCLVYGLARLLEIDNCAILLLQLFLNGRIGMLVDARLVKACALSNQARTALEVVDNVLHLL